MAEPIFEPARRVNLDAILGGTAPAEDIAAHHLANALTSTCVALQFARSRSQAMGCWHALRLLVEAKFGPKAERP